ncbi:MULTISPECIES: deoxyribodipyrimidine photo-lyase [unclassified Cryobacterium]|uniref:cryptochrome/photolyase family protein n=1 Tax=unclassified Cryobacterium TaxID=2649013 RepID=UPI002AB3C25F|nr:MULTISPECIES: deoxyribodipyrimidine photo-lyase [unclassified Cryobacterium]MDY7529299.1 deoxyribodipyrimidine photo-lyase [Cryobacterium sp. 10C2]MDY7558542.1 deoxyribodipyrimidine photo-lyase [Cryobacterium sp. 10C3]MEB0203202.1 deoxyribodipyrimidine photo-lyase [Cryobacterium sp. 5I3]MEB0291736.1 deoxyribodipyrimidine photo-lyase [Cryobacterium sp. 10C2]
MSPASGTGPTIVWFRDDLRLADNPALHAAVERGLPIVAVYVLDEDSPGVRPLGGASLWWLHGSLHALGDSLKALGGRLLLRRGPATDVIGTLAASTGAGAVFWNRRYGAAERAVDTAIKAGLHADGVEARSFAGSLLFEPWTIRTGQGNPYSVFTPFWRACVAGPPPREPYPAPESIDDGSGTLPSDRLEDWGLLPTRPDWAAGLRAAWQPGEAFAAEALDTFLRESLARYADERDAPAQAATSRLSPRLRWGEVSPFQVWHATQRVLRGADAATASSAQRFLTELGWREFSYHVLFHAPELATENLKREFDRFPWPPLDDRVLEAWQQGRTGIPLVDAGMRELWQTGSMHNRVRMVTASFLTKNLLVDWRVGERWFWDTLVDADGASNPFGWQWVAGTGADAAPYFRVFNPELQAARFDPHGEYIREYVPEIGTDAYPAPLVDLGETRRAALAAYEYVKAAKAPAPVPSA